jgi:lysine decarboxylase
MSNSAFPLDQTRMPFLESLLIEKDHQLTSFHMPGHKGTKAPHPKLLEYFGGNLHAADLVEINKNIDYLHSPRGTLREAQQLAAAAYGADHTFFLINGSTVGNMAAIMGVTGPHQKIIIPRASHRSVYGGVVLSGVTPIYIEPDYHPDIGFPLAVSVEAIELLLQQHPDVVAIHLTSPNYYGVMSDTAAICRLAHANGVAVLVDEAHGSHLGFHPELPQSTVYLGADIIVQSTHKTQGSLSQSAMLHVNDNGFVNRARIAQVLSLLQSSSPSVIFLASLDATRMQMATEGRERLSMVITLSRKARDVIRQMDGLWCYGDELIGVNNIFAFNPSKLIVRVSDTGLSGYEARSILNDQYKIEIELADLKHIVFSITVADTELTVDKLLDALRGLISQKHQIKNNYDDSSIKPPNGLPRSAISLRDAYFATKTRAVPLNSAVGHILAENVIPYPPAVPLLIPGEIMEQCHLDYIRQLIGKGSIIVGTEDSSLRTVRIVDP